MSAQTRIYIENQFRLFADAHQQIERIHFDYEEQLPNYATEDDSYPIMYVSPINSDHNLSLNRLGFRVSFFDIIQKDRTNVSNLNNIVELLATDFLRYYDKDGGAPFYFDNVVGSFPLNNYLPDYCIGRYLEVYILADGYSICDIPMENLPPQPTCPPASYDVEYADGTPIQSGTIPSGGSETIVVPNSQPCDPVTSTFNNTNLVSTPCGENKDIILMDEDNNQIGTIDNDTANLLILKANNADVEINGVKVGEVLSEGLIDVPVIQDGSPVGSWDGSNWVVPTCPPATTPLNTSTPIKTGVTTSYIAGDDGDTQRGRLTDWFNIDFTNPVFSNQKRFTGTTGGYQDETDNNYYDESGVATTEALAYPDGIIVDWASYNQVNGDVLMYEVTNFNSILVTCIADAQARTTGGFNDWNVTNFQELIRIVNPSNIATKSVIDYPPFNIVQISNNDNIWTTSGTDGGANPHYVVLFFNGNIILNNIASTQDNNSYNYIAVRYGNTSEL